MTCYILVLYIHLLCENDDNGRGDNQADTKFLRCRKTIVNIIGKISKLLYYNKKGEEHRFETVYIILVAYYSTIK